MRKFGFILCSLLWSCGVQPSRAAETTQPSTARAAEKWFDTSSMLETIFDEKTEIELTAEKAAPLFTKEFPNLSDDWAEKLGQTPRTKPTAWKWSDYAKNVGALAQRREGKPYAAVQGFSQKQIKVMILRPLGQYLWHQNHECLATLIVPRTAQFNDVFKMPEKETFFAATIKGIGHGDAPAQVMKALGKPDGTISFQPVGFFQLVYFKDDVVIYFEDSRIKGIRRGVSADLKQQIKEKGPEVVRG